MTIAVDLGRKATKPTKALESMIAEPATCKKKKIKSSYQFFFLEINYNLLFSRGGGGGVQGLCPLSVSAHIKVSNNLNSH